MARIFSPLAYTDLMDIHREVPYTVGNITRMQRAVIALAVPCRVFLTSTRIMPQVGMEDTAASTSYSQKILCAVGVDVQAGDELEVTRGGNNAALTTQPTLRFFAGVPYTFLQRRPHMEFSIDRDERVT